MLFIIRETPQLLSKSNLWTSCSSAPWRPAGPAPLPLATRGYSRASLPSGAAVGEQVHWLGHTGASRCGAHQVPKRARARRESVSRLPVTVAFPWLIAESGRRIYDFQVWSGAARAWQRVPAAQARFLSTMRARGACGAAAAAAAAAAGRDFFGRPAAACDEPHKLTQATQNNAPKTKQRAPRRLCRPAQRGGRRDRRRDGRGECGSRGFGPPPGPARPPPAQRLPPPLCPPCHRQRSPPHDS